MIFNQIGFRAGTKSVGTVDNRLTMVFQTKTVSSFDLTFDDLPKDLKRCKQHRFNCSGTICRAISRTLFSFANWSRSTLVTFFFLQTYFPEWNHCSEHLHQSWRCLLNSAFSSQIQTCWLSHRLVATKRWCWTIRTRGTCWPVPVFQAFIRPIWIACTIWAPPNRTNS